MRTEKLEEAIRRLGKPARKGLDTSPDSAFEALLEERMKGLERQVQELKGRLNGLLFAVVAAIVIQLVLGLTR